MSLINNGVSHSTSFKSFTSQQNSQPQYFGGRIIQVPKRITSFNSSGLILNSDIKTELKMFPTATSLKCIPDPIPEKQPQLNTFKEIMMLAARNNWTEKDVTAYWTQINSLINNGFNGSKKQLKNHFVTHTSSQIPKRSKSQELNKTKNVSSKNMYHQHQIKHSPKLQRFHSLNYQQPIPQKKTRIFQKARSVQNNKRKPNKIDSNCNIKRDKLLELCIQIQFSLGEGEKRLQL